MASILIADDEPRISQFITKGLAAAGFATTTVDNGADALTHALSNEFDLLILDVKMPQMDGFEVLEQLRGSGSDLPVIMLTSRAGVTDTVAGLEGGADDYIGKPFRFDELLARVRLRMRRGGSAETISELEHNGLALDVRTRRMTIDGGEPITLSAREYALAEELVRHAGQVLSREQLLARVWGYDFEPGSNVVDVYIGYLRQKLGGARISTLRGLGYRLD